MARGEGGPGGPGHDETIEEEEQADDDPRRESNLGFAQRQRYREEDETGGPELGSGEPDLIDPQIDEGSEERVLLEGDEAVLARGDDEEIGEIDSELAEDLRRAEPNPPLTVERVNPKSDVDFGFLEEPEGEYWEGADEIEEPVELETVDPLYAEREAQDKPGLSPGPLPGELDSEDEEES